jgi:hypothetical protein
MNKISRQGRAYPNHPGPLVWVEDPMSLQLFWAVLLPYCPCPAAIPTVSQASLPRHRVVACSGFLQLSEHTENRNAVTEALAGFGTCGSPLALLSFELDTIKLRKTHAGTSLKP